MADKQHRDAVDALSMFRTDWPPLDLPEDHPIRQRKLQTEPGASVDNDLAEPVLYPSGTLPPSVERPLIDYDDYYEEYE